MTVHWWHGYRADTDELGFAVIVGASTTHPEELPAKGLLSPRLIWDGDEVRARYVRSWDHEPSEDEQIFAGLIDDDRYGEEQRSWRPPR